MKKSVGIFWKICFISAGLFALLIILINFGVFGKMPSIAQLENPTIVEASEVLAADGTQLGKYYRDNGNRSIVEYKDISKHVVEALVATEDERFYEHSGIDGKSVLRAVFFMGRAGGGSTITQQLALNLFNRRSKNIVVRIIDKLKEQIIAVKLERNFTKQEIIALYLNAAPYSDNVFGIRNAARTFFQKEPDRLNVEEAAMLVGMVNGPGLYNPRRNPKAALDRRNLVINRMVTNKYLPEEEAAKVKVRPIELNYKKLDENSGLAPYFRSVLMEEMKKWCREHENPATGKPYDLYEDGLKIYTTINPRMQLYAEEAVAKHMPVLQRVLSAQGAVKSGRVWKGHETSLNTYMKNSDRWRGSKEDGLTDDEIKASFNKKVPMKVFAWNSKREKDTLMSPLDSIKYYRQMLQTAFMVMDPHSGEVKAWVGGIDFKSYKYDHVNLNTKRQVGSAIKPFLYCQAIEEVGFTPETQCEASQQYFPGFGYVPAKNNPDHFGTRTMASGLAWSVNEVAAYIMKQVTPARFTDFLKRINIQTKIEPYPSLALGACDLSMYEMLWGYTMFPNSGYSSKPVYINRIEDKNGNVIETFQTKMNQVISEASAYTMCKMLQGPVDMGTASGLRARLGAMEMGGKTGTTNDNSDAWFMGFTPQLLAGTWIGCDDRFVRLEGGLGYGGRAAMPIWEDFFRKVYADKTLGIDRSSRFVQPENIRNEAMLGYSEIIDNAPPPGAEGEDQGNGAASQYLMGPDTGRVPVESQLNAEERKVFDEATKDGKKKADNSINEEGKNASGDKKEKRGFFKRLFKPKEKDQ
ncbi:MAG: transglycosylase domain-containing protein [Chitinophagaceae bacterium]|nr:transglycosylase domain-containing protein [Chitinophagaceae bacterium]